MSINRKRRLPANDLKASLKVVNGIQLLADYAPMNKDYSSEHLERLRRAMEDAQQAEARANQAQAIARDLAIATEWELHEGALGAKTQTVAQYGPDAHQLQLIGVKRKSERRRPVRRATVVETT